MGRTSSPTRRASLPQHDERHLHQPNADLDKKFCAEAAEAGFVNLKGHRLVGGMRASIYNAMPAEGVDKLVDFMEQFRKENA